MDWWENVPDWDPDYDPFWEGPQKKKDDGRIPIVDGDEPTPVEDDRQYDDGLP